MFNAATERSLVLRFAGASLALAFARAMNKNPLSLEPLLTVEDVAEYLHVGRITVYRLVAQKRLPGFKIGGQWRFKKEALEAWLMKSDSLK